MKICVTGGGGFIGSHLVNKLKENDNIEIILFDGDLLKKEDVETFFSIHQNIDQVIHLVGGFFGDFEKMFSINVIATNNLLEQVSKFGVKKIIYASTGAVYGEPIKGISKEDDKLNPNTFYGLTKMYAEECVRYYEQKSGIKYMILRFPNVYGSGNEKGVIYNFLKSIKESGKVTIFGSGAQKRNFLHVNDAVMAVCSALEYNGESAVFNIADKEIYDLNELVVILKELGLNFSVECQPAEEANVLQVLSEDIGKAEKVLKWKPTTSLSAGFKKILSTNIV